VLEVRHDDEGKRGEQHQHVAPLARGTGDLRLQQRGLELLQALA
jgi:hypothetical protein